MENINGGINPVVGFFAQYVAGKLLDYAWNNRVENQLLARKYGIVPRH